MAEEAALATLWNYHHRAGHRKRLIFFPCVLSCSCWYTVILTNYHPGMGWLYSVLLENKVGRADALYRWGAHGIS